MTAFVLSIVRTLVPVIVGTVISWLAVLGLEIDESGQEGLSIFLTGLFIAIYYLAVRLIGQKFPGVEILLGSAKSPDSYTKGTPVEATVLTNSTREDTLPWEPVNHPSSGNGVPEGYNRE